MIREGNLTDLGEMFKNGELDMIVLNRIDVKENMDTELLFREEFLAAVPVCHEINESRSMCQEAVSESSSRSI